MIQIVEQSDLKLLESSFMKEIEELKRRIEQLESQTAKPSVVMKRFNTVDELKQYLHDTIMSASIPNLTEDEYVRWTKRVSSYGSCIKDIIYRYPTIVGLEKIEHLKAAPCNRFHSQLYTWIEDDVFYDVFYKSLPIYINDFMLPRYTNINSLNNRRSLALQNRNKQNDTPNIDETKTAVLADGILSFEFDRRYSAALAQFSHRGIFGNKINRIIYQMMKSLFTSEEIQIAHEEYKRINNKPPKSDLRGVAFVPEYAKRFIEAFENKARNV